MRSFLTYKDIYKCNVKITGTPDENLCSKVFDLEQHQRVTNCSWTSIYKHLITKGLDGVARDRYRNQCMGNHESVNTYDKLIKFLFTQFPGDTFADELYRKLIKMQQGDDEIYQYWLKYQTVLNEYNSTITTVLKYQSDQGRSLLRRMNDKEIYVKFCNSLNAQTLDKLLHFVETQSLDQELSKISTAINSVQRVMHPGHGIRDRTKPRRNKDKDKARAKGRRRSRGRQRDRSMNENQQQENKEQSDNRQQSRSRSRYRRNKKGKRRNRNRSPPTDNGIKNVTCFSCGERGHYKSKCPQRKKAGQEPASPSANTSTVPKKKKDKKANKGKFQIDWISAPISRQQYRSELFDELDNIKTEKVVEIPNDYSQPSFKTRHFDRNCNNSNVKFNRTFSKRRYIFALSTINTFNTKELDLSAPFETPLRFKDYESKENDGLYSGFLDTGSNTPAMRTEFVKEQNFPIYPVKRPFFADTANGEVILKYATVLELENINEDGNKYWMKAIFYLFNDLKIDILIDRRLMRLLGFDCKQLYHGRFVHKPGTSNYLTLDDDIFWDKLVHPDELPTIEELNYDSYPEGDIDYGHTKAHDSDDVIEDNLTEEGNALQLALARSTFDTSNVSTAGGAEDDNTCDPFDDQTTANTFEGPQIEFIDNPLEAVNPQQIIHHRIVNEEDDEIIDEFEYHTMTIHLIR